MVNDRDLSRIFVSNHLVGHANKGVTFNIDFKLLFNGQDFNIIAKSIKLIEVGQPRIVIFLRHAFRERRE